jgi:RNA polymerase sigma factor (sigma-70 family)
LTDEQLMAAVRDGDVDRLGELFERRGRLFYGYFVRLTGNPDTSHDLLQDMFLRILKYRHTYRGMSTFKTWAFRIARNLASDHHSRPTREVSLDAAGESLEAAARKRAAVLPLAQLERDQEVRMLHEAFARLPVDKRELLVLTHFEKLPYAEVAEMLSCSVGTLKTRVHRAVKDLRVIFLDRYGKRTEP